MGRFKKRNRYAVSGQIERYKKSSVDTTMEVQANSFSEAADIARSHVNSSSDEFDQLLHGRFFVCSVTYRGPV